MIAARHVPVLLQEVLEALRPVAAATLLDGTLGLGGHGLAWLDATASAGEPGRLVGLDRDPGALEQARERLEERFPGRTSYHTATFEHAGEAVRDAGLDDVDAALLDLGASSLQLDTPERGFSFRAPGPLDMRMDPAAGGETAADVVNDRPEGELARIFADYGEEPAAPRIAREIVRERGRAPFRDTLRLAETVSRACGGRRGKRHPATRAFQALRIEVNDELGCLERGLPAVLGTVRAGGRAAVISFHRLEDRLVKRFFAEGEHRGALRGVGSRTPSREERDRNPRSRSARMRAVEVLRASGEARRTLGRDADESTEDPDKE